MGKIGFGYGSEWQLTRFLGRHPAYFSALISEATDVQGLDWLDFDFKASDWLGDGEPLGLSFVEDSEIQDAFRAWWPHGSGIMNWDAVGRGRDTSGVDCWVLVEAKGNFSELGSDCGAGPKSLARISDALDETKTAFGASPTANWTNGYYQHANRLAVLYFLTKHDVDAQLVNVYFYGSTKSDSLSPQTASEWQPAITAMKTHLGLDQHDYEHRAHDVFIDMAGPNGE